MPSHYSSLKLISLRYTKDIICRRERAAPTLIDYLKQRPLVNILSGFSPSQQRSIKIDWKARLIKQLKTPNFRAFTAVRKTFHFLCIFLSLCCWQSEQGWCRNPLTWAADPQWNVSNIRVSVKHRPPSGPTGRWPFCWKAIWQCWRKRRDSRGGDRCV